MKITAQQFAEIISTISVSKNKYSILAGAGERNANVDTLLAQFNDRKINVCAVGGEREDYAIGDFKRIANHHLDIDDADIGNYLALASTDDITVIDIAEGNAMRSSRVLQAVFEDRIPGVVIFVYEENFYGSPLPPQLLNRTINFQLDI